MNHVSHTTSKDAMLCSVLLCSVLLCYAMICYTLLCYVLLCYAMLCYAMLYYVMLCDAMLYYAMLWYGMLCYGMLCYAMLCYAMLCNRCSALKSTILARGDMATFVYRIITSFGNLGDITHQLPTKCYIADVGRPSFERQKEVNREYVLVAT
jgi:hypothetical protein